MAPFLLNKDIALRSWNKLPLPITEEVRIFRMLLIGGILPLFFIAMELKILKKMK